MRKPINPQNMRLALLSVPLATLAFLLLSAIAAAQPITFERKYNFGHSETGSDLVETGDGGFMIVGTQTIFINHNNMLAMKTDAYGDLQWHSIIGSGGSMTSGGEWSMKRIIRISDSVFYAAGTTNVGTIGPADRGFFLSRLNQMGDTIWTRLYNPGTGNERLMDFLRTGDGGFLLAGYSSTFKAAYLIRTDSVGDTLWTRTWHGPYGPGEFYSITHTLDGGYAATGLVVNEYGSPFFDMFLLKMDSLGHEEWVRLYKGHDTWNGSTYGYDLVQLPDSGFVLGGRGTTYHPQSNLYKPDAFIVRTYITGDTIWTLKFGGEREERANSLVATSTGIVTIGPTSSYGKGSYDILMLKVSYSGSLEWFRTFGGTETDHGYRIIKHTDGGLAFTGRTESNCPSGCVYLIKTDSLGCVVPGCHLSSTKPGPMPEGHKITAYPNPAKDALTIEVDLHAPVGLYFTLADVMGRPVHREFADTAIDGKLAHTISVSHMPRGLYLLQISFGDTGEAQTIKVFLQ